MPRTSTGHPYRVREREDSAPCVVCLVNDGQPGIDVVMQLHWDALVAKYAFPVCSLACVIGWSELLGRIEDGDTEAVSVALAFVRAQEHYA